MNIISRQNQRAAYSLNQSMTNGLPVLTPENTNLCTSQFYGRKYTNKIYDSPNNEIQSGRQHILYQKDIEQLKEEIIQLKKENTRLKDLNKQLQFQIKLDEKEQIDKGTTQEVQQEFMINKFSSKIFKYKSQQTLFTYNI